MMRLRTTTALSMLAFVIGAAGTAWLSAHSGGGEAVLAASAATPATRYARAAPPVPAPARTPARRVAAARPAPLPTAPLQERLSGRPMPAPVVVGALDVVAAPRAEPRPRVLTPVSVPSGSTPWANLRGHLDGQIVLHVDVDGAGQVRTARIAQSSGDGVLDADALRSIRQWRFAVPPGAPDGVAGEVPVRYVSAR